MKGKKIEKGEEDRGTTRLRQVLLAAVRCRCGRDARNEDVASSPELGHLLSSYGRFPGNEANYPVLSRVLWELGKEKRQTKETKD